MKRASILAAVAILAWVGSASAHDFWIEPSVFTAKVPTSVSLRLRVGENFSGTAVRRNAGTIARFVSVGPKGQTEVPGLEGRDPAGFLRIDEPGDYVVGYETLGQPIELAADRFESYLLEEGLEHVVESRRAAGQSKKPGREIFFRCAKTMIDAQGEAKPSDSAGDQSLGLTLELLLDEDRGSIESERDVPVRLRFRGEPVQGVLVVGLRRGQEEDVVRARTDAEGRVMLPMSPGEWLLKAVHMVAAEQEPAAEWKSYWASLTVSAGT